MDVLDLLLKNDLPEPPEKEVENKRLSAAWGEPVVFKIRAVPFNRLAEIRGMHDTDDFAIHIILAGVASPDFRNKALMEKYRSPTPADLIKTILLSGEIDELVSQIERLSGYHAATFRELKKK